MIRVGLTGGLASGKSFIGQELSRLGCCLIQADELGHQVMAKGAEAYPDIVKEFGDSILTADGEIDRRKLAAVVFEKPDLLAQLSAIVHPQVRARARLLEKIFQESEPTGICVVEAAILVETGRFRDYAKLIVASCTEEQQIERAMERGHFSGPISRSEALHRLSRQMPLEEKVKYADYVIDTSGTKEHTLDQTRMVYASLRSLPPS